MSFRVVAIVVGVIIFNIAFFLMIPKIPNPHGIGLEVYHSRFQLLLVALDIAFSIYAAYRRWWAVVIVLALLILLNVLVIAFA